MNRLFGRKERFAIEVHERLDGPAAWRGDVWAAGRRLERADDSVFVPRQLMRAGALPTDPNDPAVGRPSPGLSIVGSHRRLPDTAGRLDDRFMNWGPTADNVEDVDLSRAGRHVLAVPLPVEL